MWYVEWPVCVNTVWVSFQVQNGYQTTKHIIPPSVNKALAKNCLSNSKKIKNSATNKFYVHICESYTSRKGEKYTNLICIKYKVNNPNNKLRSVDSLVVICCIIIIIIMFSIITLLELLDNEFMHVSMIYIYIY